jgi:hypothetical protein
MGREEALRPFRLSTVPESRLTWAGWLVLLLAMGATVWLGVAAGGRSVLRRVPRSVVRYYPLGAVGFAFGGGLLVVGTGAAISRVSGVPLAVPLGIPRNGIVRLIQRSPRRRMQFTVGRLQRLVLVVALLCALARLDIIHVAAAYYFGGMLLVIILGTGIVIARRGAASVREYLIWGWLAGSVLAAVCLGWMFVLIWVVEPSTRLLWMLGLVTMLGGIVGWFVGLAMVLWRVRRGVHVRP